MSTSETLTVTDASSQESKTAIVTEPSSLTEVDLPVGPLPVTDDMNQKDQSSADDASKSDTIPRAIVEQWFEANIISLSQMDKLERQTQEITEMQKFDLQDALKELTSGLRQEILEKRRMKDSLAALLQEETPDEEKDTNDFRHISVPEIRRLHWSEAATRENTSAKHFAIDIPRTEPSVVEIRDASSNDWTPVDGGKLDLQSEEATDQLSLTTLPERIRINSNRLKNWLDYEFCGGNLSYYSTTPLLILRPFKLLVYFEKAIRNRLEEYKALRKRLEDLSEEEYIQLLEESPVSDPPSSSNIEEVSSMSLPQLTALIMDCRCLTQFMDETLCPAQAYLAASPEMVRFCDLWFLFAQGSLVYIKGSSTPQKIWRVVQRTGGRRYLEKSDRVKEGKVGTWAPLVLDCFYLDFDGALFVPVFRQFEISGFDGTQAVKSLPVLPFPVAERERLADRASLMARGKQFFDCTRKFKHLVYSGRCHYMTPTGQKLTDLSDEMPRSASCYSEQIDSDVMVDFVRALQEIPWWRPMASDHDFGTTDTAETTTDSGFDKDGEWDKRFTDDFLDGQNRLWDSWAKMGGGPEGEDLLILPDRVFAFVFSTRRWACLQIGKGSDGIERLSMREAKDDPWLKLRLPDGHKELVQSLIRSHFNRKKSGGVHFDLMRNKGNGVTILLHGVPGVGKTSTAECAAISNGRPLLPVTCGDLGLSAGEVEERLKEIFRLAQDWGCIMLLDEADVFLAQRRAYDVERNALVSVFLRTLEYYEGILFLTTNRVGVFDEAFKSRIHMSLYYPPLEWKQTYDIWSSHIEEASKANVVVDKGTLTDFASRIFTTQCQPGSGPVWNGRQIRNAFQSALALAAFHTNEGAKTELSTTYFQKVFTVSDNFSRYIWTTQHQQDDAARNRDSMVRRDDFVYNASGGLYQQPLQQSSIQPQAYPSVGVVQSTSSPFGHLDSHQRGIFGGGQPHMGDVRNHHTGMQAPSFPLTQQPGQPLQQQQQMAPESILNNQVYTGQIPSLGGLSYMSQPNN